MSLALDERHQIGGNDPPDTLMSARDATADLSAFLSEHPVIQTGEEAREGKLFVDRCRATLGELEDQRTARVKPLNEQVATINSTYKAVTEPLKRTFDVLRSRLTAFAQAEEQRKAVEAENARREAEALIEAAREAERQEQEAIANAAAGELGVDVTQVVVAADRAFSDAKKANNYANRAERDVVTRIGGGFSGRSLGMRTVETLSVVDAIACLKETGMTPKIEQALLSAAREYRTDNGRLPAGIETQTTRKL